MKTDAVICIAFTSTRPSFTPLSRTAAATSFVILTNPRREGTSNHNSFLRLFMVVTTLTSYVAFENGGISQPKLSEALTRAVGARSPGRRDASRSIGRRDSLRLARG